MGTFGTGPFSNDGALDFLDELVDQPADKRREILERILHQVQDHPDLLGRKFFPDEVVAAAAVVAALLPGGDGIQQELVSHGYDANTLLPRTTDPELNSVALEALLFVAGRDGAWHEGWTDPEDAARARWTTDQLAAILSREQHSQDQELPLEF